MKSEADLILAQEIHAAAIHANAKAGLHPGAALANYMRVWRELDLLREAK